MRRAGTVGRPRQAAPFRERIVSMDVEGLFGSYDLPDIRLSGGDSRHANLAFLYGENGVGKTTILKIIYWMLSPESGKGHRTNIAAITFKSVSIKLASGHVVKAYREDRTDGPYLYSIEGPLVRAVCEVNIDSDGDVLDSTSPELDAVTNQLRFLDIDIIFVADSRDIKTTFELDRNA